MGSVLTLPEAHSRVESLVHAYCNLGYYIRFNQQLYSFGEVFLNKRSVHVISVQFEDDDELQCDDDKQTADQGGSNWAEIQIDIMEMIIQRLDIADRLNICYVCKTWRSIAMRKDILCRPQLPWMLLPRSSSCKKVSFFDMSQGKVHEFNIPEPLQGGWCCGSSKGWLLIVKGRRNRPQTFLFNPISGLHIQLPPFATIPSYYDYLENIRKAYNFAKFIMKIELSSEDALTCTISAIFYQGEVLAVCRAGENRWNVFQKPDEDHLYHDILFSNGMFYVLYTHGSACSNFTVQFPNYSVDLKLIPHIIPPSMAAIEALEEFSIIINGSGRFYLVELNGDLLIVEKIYNIITSKTEFYETDDEDEDEAVSHHLEYLQTSKFVVHKINSCSDTVHTCKLDCLDHDQVLFLGESSSLSLSATDFKDLKGNCIYFLEGMDHKFYDHNPLVCRESGVFYLDNGKIKRHFPSISHPLQMIGWFTPHPW